MNIFNKYDSSHAEQYGRERNFLFPKRIKAESLRFALWQKVQIKIILVIRFENQAIIY